jgi:hypothetical protein
MADSQIPLTYVLNAAAKQEYVPSAQLTDYGFRRKLG